MLKISKLISIFMLLAAPMALLASQKEESFDPEIVKQAEGLVSSGDYCEFLGSEGLSKEKKDLIKKYLETKYKAAFDGLRKSNDQKVSGGSVMSAAISPDGKYIVSNTNYVWNGRIPATLSLINTKTEEQSKYSGKSVEDMGFVGSLMISPDNLWLINIYKNTGTYGSTKASISIRYLQDIENEVKKIEIYGFINAYASSSGKYLVVTTYYRHNYKSFILLYNLSNLKKDPIKIEAGSFSESAMTHDDRFITYWHDSKICIKDIENLYKPEVSLTQKIYESPVFVVSKNDKYLLACFKRKVELYKLNNLDQEPQVFDLKDHIMDRSRPYASTIARENEILEAKFTPDSKNIIVKSNFYFYKLNVDDLAKFSVIGEDNYRRNYKDSWDVSPCGSYLAIRTILNSNLELYDLTSLEHIDGLGVGYDLHDSTFSPNGKSILVSDNYYKDNNMSGNFNNMSGNFLLTDISKICPIQFTLPQSLLIAYLNNKSDGYAKEADVNFSAIAKSFNNPEIQEMLGEKFGVLLLKNYILPDLAKITEGYLLQESSNSSSSSKS